jgi:hypothetical protein
MYNPLDCNATPTYIPDFYLFNLVFPHRQSSPPNQGHHRHRHHRLSPPKHRLRLSAGATRQVDEASEANPHQAGLESQEQAQ